MSAATLNRMLAPVRVQLGALGRCGTRPGTLLRTQILVRTELWDVQVPGYLEAVSVAHCGQSMAGDFCWSVTFTDIHNNGPRPALFGIGGSTPCSPAFRKWRQC